MRQLECSSKWSQMYYLNAPEKNEKFRTTNLVFVEISFIVCMLSNSGKFFINANFINEKSEKVQVRSNTDLALLYLF